MSRVILTGATSFIGHELAKQLLMRGDEVFALVRPGSKNDVVLHDCPGINIIKLDLVDIAQLTNEGIRADVFVHLGWDGIGSDGRNDSTIQKRNVQISLESLYVANNIGCKTFLFAGSQSEYGIVNGIYIEESACNPIIPYGKAKLEVYNQAKQLSAKYGIQYIHARIFSVYGPGDHPWTLVSDCINKLSAGKTIELSDCKQFWNFLYVSDAAKALISLITKCQLVEDDPIFNIASNDTRILKEFVDQIYRVLGHKGTLLYGARRLGLEKPISIVPDISKIRRVTGWEPGITFEQGIKNILMYQGIK